MRPDAGDATAPAEARKGSQSSGLSWNQHQLWNQVLSLGQNLGTKQRKHGGGEDAFCFEEDGGRSDLILFLAVGFVMTPSLCRRVPEFSFHLQLGGRLCQHGGDPVCGGGAVRHASGSTRSLDSRDFGSLRHLLALCPWPSHCPL